MLKLLLNHWQVHREPSPFVLTEDPLYCAHLTTTTTSTKLPEVYAVNRINPIFEDDEGDTPNYSYEHHKRTHSENETRSSDDTGYTSGHKKSSLDDDSFDQHLSTDSDEPVKSVLVSADVHRVSYPDDVIVLSRSSRCSFCSRSVSSRNSTSSEPYDSLTATNQSPTETFSEEEEELMKIGSQDQTEVKRPSSVEPTMNARAKLEKLLQQGNPRDHSSDSSHDMERTKNALMHSLNRALHQKVPKVGTSSSSMDDDSVTRADSATKELTKIPEGQSPDETVPLKTINDRKSKQDPPDGVTRRDESLSSSSNSNSSSSRKRHHHKRHHQRHKDGVPKPLTLHQLLPGHWSYDNVYLPQMPGVCYHCLHHHQQPHRGGLMHHVPDSDFFYPMYYHHGRSRHSWAPRSTPNSQGSSENHSQASKKNSSSEQRSSPDGSSRDSESHQERLHHSLPERRSLRVPKKCKCEDCLAAALDTNHPSHSHLPPTHEHMCACLYLPHRRVKFASDTDLTKVNHVAVEMPEKDFSKLTPLDKLANPVFPINLHRLNGHVNVKSLLNFNDEVNTKKSQLSTTTRGQKEPVKVDEFYRTYPINFRDWEAHYRRNYLQKRRKRALNMIAMAIGIILVVGVAIAMTFIFLRLKRPS